ncbi:MAG TPA: hypothetical protein VHY20_14320, partial [Pirellulales bacterium]|nr:hypothetical protein [Pirellulales bacterium]
MDENPATTKARQQARRRRAASMAGAALLLVVVSGCTTSLRQWWHNGWKVGPNYKPPCGPVAQQWIDAGDQRLLASSQADQAWWTVFSDATLDSLVDSAYRQNLDLRAAGTRILQSRAQRNIAAGNLFP